MARHLSLGVVLLAGALSVVPLSAGTAGAKARVPHEQQQTFTYEEVIAREKAARELGFKEGFNLAKSIYLSSVYAYYYWYWSYGYDDYGGVAASARAAAGPRVSEYYSYSPPAKASSITFTKKLAVKVNTRTQWKRNGKLVAHTTHLGTLHHKHTACTDTWSRSAKLTGTIHFNTGNRKLGSVVSKSWPVTVRKTVTKSPCGPPPPPSKCAKNDTVSATNQTKRQAVSVFASRPAKTNRVNEQLSVSRTGTKRRPASFYAAMSLVNAPGTALKLKQNLSSGSLAASGGSPLLTGTLRFIQTTTPSTYNCAPLSTTQVPSNFKNGSKPFTAHFRAIGNQRLVRTAPVAGYVNRTQ